MAKLPIKVKAELERIQEREIPHHYGVIEMYKRELQEMDETDYVKYGEMCRAQGRLDGCYLTIENMLHAYNCYKGYSDWKQDGLIWRESHRHYYL